MIRINLLPVRLERKKETVRQQVSIAILSTVFLAVVLGGLHLAKVVEIKRLKTEIDSLNQEFARLKKEIGELTRIKNDKKVLEEKLNIVRQLEQNKTGPMRMLEEITRAIPEKAWIETLKDSDTATVITGVALSEEVIAEFMRGMEKSPNMSKVVLEVSQQTDKGGVKLKGFILRLEKGKSSPKT
ncbi:MAG: PilN domain-containing protein [Deltaproteobacteria bacterium]|nr:PilN domain-containing protein [Deltaproteobacteria bacterium]